MSLEELVPNGVTREPAVRLPGVEGTDDDAVALSVLLVTADGELAMSTSSAFANPVAKLDRSPSMVWFLFLLQCLPCHFLSAQQVLYVCMYVCVCVCVCGPNNQTERGSNEEKRKIEMSAQERKETRFFFCFFFLRFHQANSDAFG